MKICRECREEKSKDEFHRREAAIDGLQGICKECTSKIGKAWRAEHPTYGRNWHYQDRYGLTLEERNELIKDGCAICNSQENIHIDHCHETNAIRGALCYRCNTLIGYARESIDILKSAIEYLERENL